MYFPIIEIVCFYIFLSECCTRAIFLDYYEEFKNLEIIKGFFINKINKNKNKNFCFFIKIMNISSSNTVPLLQELSQMPFADPVLLHPADPASFGDPPKYLLNIFAGNELQNSSMNQGSRKCCSCGCFNKIQGCWNAVKTKFNGGTKCFHGCKKAFIDKYNKKLIDDIFFKINTNDQQIQDILDPTNDNGRIIYLILEREYATETIFAQDKDFIGVMYKHVMKIFLQSMAHKSAILNAKGNLELKDLQDWGNFLKADFQGKRLVEQDCLDVALQELRNKNGKKLDLSDYHKKKKKFSNELANKLLKYGYYHGKDVLDEEIQSVRTLDNRKDYLKQMNLLDHSLESLVDLFNIMKQENRNVATVGTTINEVINNYISNAQIMKAEIVYSLMPLAFIDDVQTYKKFLHGVLNDISTQQLFDPLKVTLLRKVILIGAVSSPGKLKADDVMHCIRLVLDKLKYLAVDDKNENLQKCMDALCDLLFIAVSYLQVTGITKERIQEITAPLTHLQQHGLEKIYNVVTKKSNDPSLRIKYSYAMDFISGIGGTKYERWVAAQRLLDAAFTFAFMSICAGYTTNITSLLGEIAGNISKISREALQERISKFQEDIIGQNNENVQASKEEFYRALQEYQPNDGSVNERWYERVNSLRMAETSSMKDVFDKIYSVNCGEKHTKDEFVTYYSTKLLLDIIADKKRKSYEQKEAIKALYAIYENCNRKELDNLLNDFCQGKKRKVTIGTGNFANTTEIKLYIKQEMGKIHNSAQNENIKEFTFEVLEQMCKQSKEPIDQYLKAIPPENLEPISSREVVKEAIKRGLQLQYIFSNLRKKCTDYYNKGIKPTYLIKVEGDLHENSAKERRSVSVAFFGNKTSIVRPNKTLFAGPHQPKKKKKKKQLQFDPQLEPDALADFLNIKIGNPGGKVWLIRGNAKTGKTLLLRGIEYFLWNKYATDYTQGYIPIYVRLAETKNPNDCFTSLLNPYGNTHGILDEMRMQGQKYLFILDGFDDLRSPKNLYIGNKIEEFVNSKLIISCRDEYLEGYGNSYYDYFKPAGDEEIFEYRITPVKLLQMIPYIKNRAKQNKQNARGIKNHSTNEWAEPDRYTEEIKNSRLEPLMSSPYMGKTIIDIIPNLTQSGNSSINKGSIYKVFTKIYFDNQSNKIAANEMIPLGYDLKNSFYEYSKDLSFHMWLADKTSVDRESVNYIFNEKLGFNQNKFSDPFSRFFSNDAKTILASKGAEITTVDSQVSFNHKSIMEYFIARTLYDVLKRNSNLDGETVRKIFGERLIQDENQTDQESDVMDFLIDMITNNDLSQTNETTAHIIPKLQALKNIINEEENQAQFGNEGIYAKNMFKVAMRIPKVFLAMKDELIAVRFKYLGYEFFYDSCTQDFLPAMIRHGANADYGYEKYTGGKLVLKNQISVPHGKGELTYADGFIYQGIFEKGKRHGYGILTYPDRSRYAGDFENEKKHGKGKFISAVNGSIYEGAFVQGKKHGVGKIKYIDGRVYEGVFENDERQKQGQGTLIEVDGSVYEGVFENEKKHGHGILTSPDGSYYEGEFIDDTKNGKGKEVDRHGNIFYEGVFINGERGDKVCESADKALKEQIQNQENAIAKLKEESIAFDEVRRKYDEDLALLKENLQEREMNEEDFKNECEKLEKERFRKEEEQMVHFAREKKNMEEAHQQMLKKIQEEEEEKRREILRKEQEAENARKEDEEKKREALKIELKEQKDENEKLRQAMTGMVAEWQNKDLLALQALEEKLRDKDLEIETLHDINRKIKEKFCKDQEMNAMEEIYRVEFIAHNEEEEKKRDVLRKELESEKNENEKLKKTFEENLHVKKEEIKVMEEKIKALEKRLSDKEGEIEERDQSFHVREEKNLEKIKALEVKLIGKEVEIEEREKRFQEKIKSLEESLREKDGEIKERDQSFHVIEEKNLEKIKAMEEKMYDKELEIKVIEEKNLEKIKVLEEKLSDKEALKNQEKIKGLEKMLEQREKHFQSIEQKNKEKIKALEEKLNVQELEIKERDKSLLSIEKKNQEKIKALEEMLRRKDLEIKQKDKNPEKDLEKIKELKEILHVKDLDIEETVRLLKEKEKDLTLMKETNIKFKNENEVLKNGKNTMEKQIAESTQGIINLKKEKVKLEQNIDIVNNKNLDSIEEMKKLKEEIVKVKNENQALKDEMDKNKLMSKTFILQNEELKAKLQEINRVNEEER